MEWVQFSELRRSHLFHAVLVLSLSEINHSCSSELSQMPLYFVFYLLVWSLPARDLSGHTPKGGCLSWREYLPSATGRLEAGYYRWRAIKLQGYCCLIKIFPGPWRQVYLSLCCLYHLVSQHLTLLLLTTASLDRQNWGSLTCGCFLISGSHGSWGFYSRF